MDSNSPPIELSERKPKDTDEGPNIATPDHVGAKTGQKEVPDEKISQVVPHDVLLRLQSQQQEEIEEVEEELFEDLDEDEPDCFHRNAAKIQKTLSAFYQDHKNIFLWSFYAVLILGYIVYFIYAMWYSFGDEGSIRLVVLTVFLVLMALAAILKPRLKNCVLPSVKRFDKSKLKYVRWAFYIIATLVIASIIIAEVAVKKPANLMSGVGIIVYVAVFFIFSHNPAKVKWRPVFMGLLLQFIFALIILRTESGFHSFMWLGDRVSEFLDHTDFGAEFVLGDATHHFFAFKILPIVIFFSTCISILYYWGAMQWIIFRVAWVMQVAMGTTAAESVNAAANIFIGQSEAPLMIRPLLPKMTNSELHAVMTGGFATIAGTVLGAFIGFGVPANHLLSASVISAPAALAMAKLFYPETKKSKTTVQDIENMEKGPERSVIQAASNGASQSIKLVANIAVNLVAFLALMDLVNGTLTWAGNRVGLEKLTLQIILSYLLWPFAFVMGAAIPDCRKVAELIGVKTLVNEFVAFDELGKLIRNRKVLMGYNDTVVASGEDLFLPGLNKTLVGGVLTERSEVLSTYALCGFSNVGSIGVMLGALGAMAPRRKRDLAKIVIRAMIAGNVASFMTACIAGLFYVEIDHSGH